MEEKDIQYDFRNVPQNWALCFLEECPVKDKCLRQLVGSHLKSDREFGPSIYPTMKRSDEGCRLFVTSQPKQMAWGFDTLFSNTRYRDVVSLRSQLKKYLGGHSNYYRYHNGQRLLSPQQQEWIIALFKKYHYQDHLKFDHYACVYDYHVQNPAFPALSTGGQ